MAFLYLAGFFGAISLFCWITTPLIQSANKKLEKQLKESGDKEWAGRGVSYIKILHAKYKGGIKNISSNGAIPIHVLDIGLGFSNGLNKKIIKFENIKDLCIENERSIQQQVSLGKLIMFGALAFGMNKKNIEINKEYVVINVLDEDGEYNVVLDTENQENIQSLYNQISTYKNKVIYQTS